MRHHQDIAEQQTVVANLSAGCRRRLERGGWGGWLGQHGGTRRPSDDCDSVTCAL